MKKIVIAGGTGFLGIALKNYFEAKGFVVISLSRKRNKDTIYWNGKDLGEWTKHLEDAEVLINLAGKSVDCRYTDENKAAILNTEENGVIGDDFSMNIAKSWEKEFYATEIPDVRKIALRTSIVLGKNGGAFPKLKTITRLGMGGKQGRGDQFISWIHIHDFCKTIDFLINSKLSRSVNITAPNPKTNKDFMRDLRKQLSVPIGISQPVWLLELASTIIKTETELLLKSRYVYPQRLLDAGFKFEYERVKECLKELV